jgi:hypothetical protein
MKHRFPFDTSCSARLKACSDHSHTTAMSLLDIASILIDILCIAKSIRAQNC